MATAKGNWKRLRETFVKKLAEIPVKHSGDGVGDDEKPYWPFFESLLFLKDQCTARKSTGNFSTQEGETSSLSTDPQDDACDTPISIYEIEITSETDNSQSSAHFSREVSPLSTPTHVPLEKKSKKAKSR